FWSDIGRNQPGLQEQVLEVLSQYSHRRPEILMTLQRQNFFVQPSRLPEERLRLIHALAGKDLNTFMAIKEAYQVEPVRRFLESPQGIPIRVRLFEFIYPARILDRLSDDAVYPDLENQKNFAEPLLELRAAGKISGPSWDRWALHALDTEVLVLNGVQDHTSDYRAAAVLAYCYPRGHLFLADDDHQFHAMAEGGVHSNLVRTFLISGPESDAYRSSLAAAERFRWKE
ncbi:MAG TPA: hypothetical protein PLV45_18665, partial [bacterium]|nr:hypothetical protein [bacterium]